MMYLVFHLIFTVPPILVLGATLPRPLAGVGGWRGRLAIPILCGIAFTYTAPWDNYLVAREVWWYGPNRVMATVGYVPVEEYGFFLLQPILSGLVLYHVLPRWAQPSQLLSERVSSVPAWVGAALWLALTALGFGILVADWTPGVYMGLILAWASPVLAGIWLYDGGLLWRLRRVIVVSVGIPTLYLWIADAIAIRAGIWSISSRFTLGVAPLGLPIEEATFFLMTNLLAVNGILLLLFGGRERRVRERLQSRTVA